MRATFIAASICLLAVPAFAQTVPRPGMIAPPTASETTLTEPLVIQTNDSQTPALTVYGPLAGISVGSSGTAGQFRSAGTGVVAAGTLLGIDASCAKTACTGMQVTALGGGIGMRSSGGIAIEGVATGTLSGRDSLAGHFVGGVRVEGPLVVQGPLVSREVEDLAARLASLAARLNALDGGGVGEFYTRIQAEDYDQGGQGVGYLDTSAGNEGGAYRNEDVDIKASRFGGYAVGWMPQGEWLAYTVRVPADGTYSVRAMVGTTPASVGTAGVYRTVSLRIDDVVVSDAARVPVFSDWDQYGAASLGSFQLTAGPHVLKFGVEGWDYMDFQYFDITRE
jgi:hypothetical protein